MLSHLSHPHASSAGKTGIVLALSVYVCVSVSLPVRAKTGKIPTRNWCT